MNTGTECPTEQIKDNDRFQPTRDVQEVKDDHIDILSKPIQKITII
jgi:hypothetical protein